MSCAAATKFIGHLDYQQIGSTLSVADFNGGGQDDLLFGQDSSDTWLTTNLIYGPLPSGTLTTDDVNAWFNNSRGYNAKSVGDLNGDGRADLVIGYRAYPAYLFYGQPTE